MNLMMLKNWMSPVLMMGLALGMVSSAVMLGCSEENPGAKGATPSPGGVGATPSPGGEGATPSPAVKVEIDSGAAPTGRAFASLKKTPTPEVAAGLTSNGKTPVSGAEYVGRGACSECHEKEVEAWTDSHHDWSMKLPTDETVLADFDNVKYLHNEVTMTFFKKDGKFIANAEGPDGVMRDYPIKYTFGKTPLQQFLVEFEKGRLQTLSATWDTLGEKWYDLHEDEPIRIMPNDELHWATPNANWNFMCADCHSTDLVKGYDEATDSYDTTFKEINVSCEACHGPGSEHVKWAEADAKGEEYGIKNLGLVNELSGPDDRMQGEGDVDKGTFVKLVDDTNWKQVEVCARCHARRNLTNKHYVYSEEMLDNILPQLLREGIYHADGQIQDEVYVYGSFVQSKMYHAGVRCSDCHDPHTANLITPDGAPSNLLCVRCHKPDQYDSEEHHHHPLTAFVEAESEMKIPTGVMGIPEAPGVPGTNCVDCHMPTVTYMGVDPRRDHSMRVPRPDLSDAIHAPNACTKCHADKDNAWATAATTEWYGSKEGAPKHYGEILDEARHGNAEILPELIGLTQNEDEPIIVRATGLALLERFPTQEAVDALAVGIKHEDALMRHSAAGGFTMLPAEQRMGYVGGLLGDPVGVVRAEAARVLTGVPDAQFNMIERANYVRAVDTFKDLQEVNIDRPEANLNMALLNATMEHPNTAEAEKYFRRAVAMNPLVHQARFHLAQYLRQLGRDGEAEPLLRTVIEHHDDYGDAHYDLGLLLATSGRMDEGLVHLGRAAQLMPTFPRVYYNYALALNQSGKKAEALLVMGGALQISPSDRDIMLAMVTLNRDAGKYKDAYGYARQLVQLTGGDQGAVQLMRQIEGLMGGVR